MDRREAITAANQRFRAPGLAERCELRVGDFFGKLPGGGDRYLLRHILHDWDDVRATAILRSCHRAMTADAKLVIVEFAAAERGDTAEAAKAAALMDLYMMSLFDGGRERTIAELTGLLCGAGFVVDHVTPLIGGAIMIEAAVGDKYGWH